MFWYALDCQLLFRYAVAAAAVVAVAAVVSYYSNSLSISTSKCSAKTLNIIMIINRERAFIGVCSSASRSDYVKTQKKRNATGAERQQANETEENEQRNYAHRLALTRMCATFHCRLMHSNQMIGFRFLILLILCLRSDIQSH